MPDKSPLGVLIIHGFTSSLDAVSGLVPTVERLGLPYRVPVLRGHNTRYQDLDGVVARDWYEDALAAMNDLLHEVEQVVVVGFSMGGLVALNLAMDHGERMKSLILVAPALRFADPLVHLTPLLKAFFKYWSAPNSFNDPFLAKNCSNYPKFPTATFSTLLDYAREMERRLGEVKVPTLLIHSLKDTVISPLSSKIAMEQIGSREKKVVWFERSGHEMMQDMEAERVFEVVRTHLETLMQSSVEV